MKSKSLAVENPGNPRIAKVFVQEVVKVLVMDITSKLKMALVGNENSKLFRGKVGTFRFLKKLG